MCSWLGRLENMFAQSSAALRAQMQWPARRALSQQGWLPCNPSSSFAFASTSRTAAARPFCQSARNGAKVTATKGTASAAGSATATAAAALEPIVIYRGGAQWRPIFYLAGGLSFAMAGFSLAPLVWGHLSWPIFSFSKEAKKPELLPPATRGAVAVGLAMLGSGIGFFFYLVPLRSITRLTVHPASKELAIRTSLPSPLSLLPLKSMHARNGLRHPLATKDAKAGSPRDMRTRVLPLVNVSKHFGQSNAQDFAIHQLSPQDRTSLAFVLPTLSDALTITDRSGKKRSAVRSAKTTDMLYLDVKPFKLLFGLRASGGEPVKDFVSPDGTRISASETKALASSGQQKGQTEGAPSTVKSRSLYAVGWEKFRRALMQETDYDDLNANQAERLRFAGDPYIRAKWNELSRRRGNSSSTLADSKAKVLSPKEPWFRDRANFDSLLPVQKP